jgi:hypothetical protein
MKNLAYEHHWDTGDIGAELKAVRAKRDALERALGFVSVASRRKSLDVVKGLFEETVRLRSTIGELKNAMQRDATSWSTDMVPTSARLHKERARYFETMSRCLTNRRETTHTGKKNHVNQSSTLPSGPATPDLLLCAAQTANKKDYPNHGINLVRSHT